MTTTIAILNQKGGVGKTTFSTNLASLFHKKHGDTLLIDLDPQGSASDWDDQKATEESNPLPVVSVKSDQGLEKHKTRITKGYKWVFIDGAPQIKEKSVSAIKASDIVIIPVQPSPYDVWACADLVDLIKMRQELTEGKPKAAFVISRAIKNTKLSREVKKIIKEYGMPLFESYTTQRVDYIETVKTGQSVIDLPKDNKAHFEIRSIAKEIEAFITANTEELATI